MAAYDTLIRRIIPEVEYHQNRYARILDEVVAPGCRWLDIGAGTRIHTGWIGRSGTDLAQRCSYVVGCDLEIGHLAANRSLSGAVGADATHLPFADGSFDVVSANMVLEHLPRPQAVFDEVARTLAPGGRFVFVTPHRGHPAVRLSSILLAPWVRRRLAVRVEGRDAEHVFLTHYAANTPRQIATLARRAGLHAAILEVFASLPILRRPVAAAALEALWLRTHRWAPLRRRFGSNLIGCLEKR